MMAPWREFPLDPARKWKESGPGKPGAGLSR